jgi:hypothetical protein
MRRFNAFSVTAALVAAAGSAHAQQCGFISQPISQTRCVGSSFTLEARVIASGGSTTYQWFKDNQPIPGATGSIYSDLDAQPADAGRYKVRVRVTGAIFGNCDSFSNDAVITVVSPAGVADLTGFAPARLGEPRTFTVTPTGTGPFTYEWFYGNPGTLIPGATGPSYTVNSVDVLDYGMYSARVSNTCGGVAVSATLQPVDSVLDREYTDFIRGLIASEIVRSRQARNPNPRMIAVLAAIYEVAARNPLITPQQLADFATAYNTQLSAAYAGDPNLRGVHNLHTAVRFRVRVTSLPGLNTDIGEAVMAHLGLDPDGPDRQLEMIAFQNSTGPRLSVSDAVAKTLQQLFQNRDATGARNDLVAPAAAAYLRSLGIEPYPTPEEVRSEYPEIAAAIQQLPPSRGALDAERAANFTGVRAAITANLNQVSGFINAEIAEIQQLAQQYPTLESAVAASRNQAIVNEVIAERQGDILELSQRRAAISMATAMLGTGSFSQQQEAAVLRNYANTTIWLADTTSDTISTYMRGTGSILSGVGSIVKDGPLGLLGGVGSIMTGVGIILPEVIPGNGAPSPYQQLSDQITVLQNQVEQIRVTMIDRFNRVDLQLSQIYSALNGGFAAMIQYFQTLQGNVVNIQTSLALAQSNINRFEQNLYGVLQDGFNFPFVADMNTALGYRDRLQTDLTLTQFGAFEGRFFSAATNDAASQTFAGPDATLQYDSTAINQLDNFPLGFNINNLRTFTNRALGLPSLGSIRVPNPTTWSLNADTYAQLARENPWYFAQLFSGAPSRLNSVDGSGEAVQQVMHNARSQQLFNRLLDDQGTRADALRVNINTALSQYLVNPSAFGGPASPDISQANLWGGTTQRPVATPSFVFPSLNNRMGFFGTFCGISGGTAISNIGLMDQPQPNTVQAWLLLPDEYVLAAYLQLPNRAFANYAFAVRQAGGSGSQGQWSVASNGTDYSADIDVEVWHLPNPAARTFPVTGTTQAVTIPGCSEARTLVVTRRYALRMNSSTSGWTTQPAQAFRNRWENQYVTGGGVRNPIKNQFFTAQSEDTAFFGAGTGQTTNPRVWTATNIVDAAGLAQVRGEINDRLRSHQSAFLGRIASALGNGPDVANVKAAADLISVNARLVDFYASLAIPESTVASDLIRGVLRGGELGLDREGSRRFIDAARLAIPTTSGAPAPTVFPNVATEMTRRRGLFRDDLNIALTTSRPAEFYPFMKWTLAGLDHLRDTALNLAVDDAYVVAPNSTLNVNAANGLRRNDAAPARDGLTSRFIPESLLVSGPASGSLTLNPDGSFSYTPAPGFQGEVSFSYRLRGDIQPPLQNLVTSNPARVLIRVADCVPSVSNQPVRADYTAGGSAAFSVTASGQGRLAYQWRKNGVNLVAGGRITGVDTPSLVITNLQETDRGQYDVVITGACGSITSNPAGLGACEGDWDGDGVIDFNDLLAFLNDYNAQAPRADVNGDGTIDFNDFLAFLNLYNTPC